MVFKLAGTVMGFLIKSCEIFSFMSLSIEILFNYSRPELVEFRASISRSWIYSFTHEIDHNTDYGHPMKG